MNGNSKFENTSNIGGFVGWMISYFLFNLMIALRWLWQILHGRYQIINNHRVPGVLVETVCVHHTCAICLPCCRGMSHNVATNWLFRICLKHRCSIHLSYHLVCYNYSNTKLTKKWIFSLYSSVHEIFLDIMQAITKGNLHILVGLRSCNDPLS